ncbi:hypothetical protein C8R45DRAFT_1033920 [Mycena sanguinolenta]|nr:hypothetical protein C8R45DRAFT_1033920 [Mycena sanguinolenta]
MPEEFMGDNSFQWIVEMHSFDEMLPIAEDLTRVSVFHLFFGMKAHPFVLGKRTRQYSKVDSRPRIRLGRRSLEL